MPSTYGTTTPCVQIADSYIQYWTGLPIAWQSISGVSHPAIYVYWPDIPEEASSSPADNPDGTTGTGDWVWLNPADLDLFLALYPEASQSLGSRNLLIFKLLITCPGIWDTQNSSFTYTHNLPYLPGYDETNIMTMLDVHNSFPAVIPDNEQIELEIAWDYRADQVGLGASGQSQASTFVLSGLQYCIAPIMIPFIPAGAPEEDPFEAASGGGGDAAAGGGGGTEADSEEESGGPPSSSGGTADESDASAIPGGADSSSETEAESNSTNSAIPGARYTRKTLMKTVFKPARGPSQGDKRKPSGINPNSRDVLSSKKPLTRIAEYREAERGITSLAQGLLNLPGMVTRSPMENTPNQPGTAVIPSQIFQQGSFSDIIGSRTEYLTTKVESRVIGTSLTTTDGRANPTYTLLNASELAGSGSLNINAYTYKTSGKNIKELLAKHAVKAPAKVDANGRLLKSAKTKDGIASLAPTSAIELFLVNRLTSPDKFKTKNFSRRSTEPLAPTNANQDYETPESGDFNIVGDSNIIYNGGAGLFYGTGPFLNFESEEVLNAIFDINNKGIVLKAYTGANDSLIVDTNLVVPASVGVLNRSKHRTEHGCLVILGILTSDQSFRWFSHNKINIPPSTYSFMNAAIPPGMPPGAARIIGMVFSSNNKLLVSSDQPVVIAPDGYTVEGYTSQSPFLPGSLGDLTNNPVWTYATRIYPRPNERRRLVATSDTIDLVVKIPQIASDGGLNTEITVTDGVDTWVSSSRFNIDGVEIFPGSHDCHLQFTTQAGRDIDIQITDVADKVHPIYSYVVHGTNLEHPTDLIFGGIANDDGYIGGIIQTPILNGSVLLSNNRTNSNIIVSTKQDGVLLFDTPNGYSGNDEGIITQANPGDTPSLGFDSLPGDGITIRAQGPGGGYGDIVVTNILDSDDGALLPTDPYTMPEEPVLPHVIFGGPNTNGDIIPPMETGAPWEIPDEDIPEDIPDEDIPEDIPEDPPPECFVAGTQITMALGSPKNIEDILVGDEVLSYSIHDKKLVTQEVIGLFDQVHTEREIAKGNHTVKIALNNGTVLHTTMGNPFWSKDKGFVAVDAAYSNKNHAWVKASNFGKDIEQIETGQILFEHNMLGSPETCTINEIKVQNIEYILEPDIKTYDISIKDTHLFFADSVLTHNTPDPDPDPEPEPGPGPFGDGGCIICVTDNWKVEIVQICQRPSNPCLIDITMDIYMCDIDGNPATAPFNKRCQIVNELCAFSLDSTMWYQLIPFKTDPQHSGDGDFDMPKTYNFVADMCNHFSSFFSTQSIMFKIVFRVGTIDSNGTFVPDCTDAEILQP